MSEQRGVAGDGQHSFASGPIDEPSARDLLDRAREQANAGEYELASAIYARLTGNPNPLVHVAALLGLADSRYRLDDEEGALQAWLAATQAPETELTWRAWTAIAGARVRQGDLAGAARSYREAERRAPPMERPAIASRLGWLNKEMGNTITARRHFGRARTDVGFTPLVTWSILAITVPIGVVVLFVPAAQELYALLQLNKQAVLAGEWWRLLTVVLVHSDRLFIHLVFNMFALYIVGPIVEGMYGRVPFLGFYLLTALAGSTASFMLSPIPAVGASGAIFGLFGALAVSTWVHKPALGGRARALSAQIGLLIVINLFIGFTVPGIDNAAHLGGLVAGAWLGLVIVPRGTATLADFWRRVPTPGAQAPGSGPHPLLQVAGVLLLTLVILIALSIGPLWAGGR